MAADDLATKVARSSAVMVLAMYNEEVLIFYNSESLRHATSRCREIIENVDMFPK